LRNRKRKRKAQKEDENDKSDQILLLPFTLLPPTSSSSSESSSFDSYPTFLIFFLLFLLFPLVVLLFFLLIILLFLVLPLFVPRVLRFKLTPVLLLSSQLLDKLVEQEIGGGLLLLGCVVGRELRGKWKERERGGTQKVG
jgi:hypothetical protein